VFSFGFRSAAAGGLEMLQVRGGLGEPVALEGCCPVSLTTGTPTNQTVVQGSDLHMVRQQEKNAPCFFKEQ
jgi:hypothetical protein